MGQGLVPVVPLGSRGPLNEPFWGYIGPLRARSGLSVILDVSTESVARLFLRPVTR